MSHTVLSLSLLIFLTLISLPCCNAYKKNKKNYDPSEEKKIPVQIKLLGDLATPHPDSDIELGFVPKQVYYQVRRYDTKKKVPQSEAYKEANTPEEIINAPRLREVLTHKKTQEVYEEQGYEDAGYDHGGSARHKAENEKLLEHYTGEKDGPKHSEDEEQTDEEERPSKDNRESLEETINNNVDNTKSNTDTLSEMNSDANHRQIRPNKNDDSYGNYKKAEMGRLDKDRKKPDGSLIGKRKQTKIQSRDREFILRHEENPFSNKLTGKKVQRKPNRRIDYDQGDIQGKSQHLRFDPEKYPFYNLLNSNKYTRNSALKYASNPKEIPIKLANKMSFYNSRKLHCDDVTGPEVETPNGEEKSGENSELKNPDRGKPRMGRLGESIDCLKRKFFGHDPLDNPFFRESLDS